MLILLLILSFGCQSPADPVAYGTLCLPTRSDCPDSIGLHRDAVGGNTLDFALKGDSEGSDVLLRVTTTEELPATFGVLVRDEEGRRILVSRDYGLGPGETIAETLGPFLLTTVKSLELEIQCLSATCAAELDYVLIAEPLECVDNGDCNRFQSCEITTGRCVECLTTQDCSLGQSCDREAGLCLPQTSGGCSVSRGSPLEFLFLFGFFGLLLTLKSRRRKYKTGRNVAFFRVLFGACLLLPIQTPTGAEAAPPRAAIAAGGGLRMLTGELGRDTGPGYGFVQSQELRTRYVGGSLSLSTARIPTNHQGPPNNQTLHTYGLTLGPRGYVPYKRFEFFGGPEYLRWGVTSNALVRQMGLEVMYNGAGGVLGARYRWMGLEARLEASYYALFGLPGALVNVNLMLGIAP